jgi:hypothetical protein
MTAEPGHMYAYDYLKRCWTPFAISKITKMRIFLAVAEGARQCSLDRTKVEAEGSAWLYRGWAAVRLFYSAARRAAVEAKWARTRAEIRRFADLLEHGDLLGLGAIFTREDVLRAFRLQAQKHHLDKGGDPEIFRSLVRSTGPRFEGRGMTITHRFDERLANIERHLAKVGSVSLRCVTNEAPESGQTTRSLVHINRRSPTSARRSSSWSRPSVPMAICTMATTNCVPLQRRSGHEAISNDRRTQSDRVLSRPRD